MNSNIDIDNYVVAFQYNIVLDSVAHYMQTHTIFTLNLFLNGSVNSNMDNILHYSMFEFVKCILQ